MKTYAWMSDTHFNFVQEDFFAQLCKEIRKSSAEAIFLTGDIAESVDVEHHLRCLTAQTHLPVYFVLGNHDYYRGSIVEVNQKIQKLHDEEEKLFWMDACPPIWLKEDTALVGVGGWGDARAGDFMNTPIRLNDHRLIAELTGIERAELKGRLESLGREMAIKLKKKLQACTQAQKIWVLTHVPPFVDSCWHEGNLADNHWSPDFVCVSVGESLKEFALEHHHISIQVMCGHGHSRGVAHITPNLSIHTAAAEYRKPRVEAFWRC